MMRAERASTEIQTIYRPAEASRSRYQLATEPRDIFTRETPQHMRVYRDLPVDELIHRELAKGFGERNEALQIPRVRTTIDGALAVITAPDTGRSPDDKFIVPSETKNIWFKEGNKGSGNNKIRDDHFATLHSETLAYLQEQPELYEQNLFLGTDPDHRKHVRILTTSPWHAAFADRLYVVPSPEELKDLQKAEPDITMLHAPNFNADSKKHGTRPESNKAIALDFDRKSVVIVGTKYGGEVKKSGLTEAMGFLPEEGVLPMHCSAVITDKGETAIFFGLSGTGKTTLSSDPRFLLIGDDEHGWGPNGVFNLEGGCYPKAINLNPELEPEIHAATNQKGSIMENVVINDGTPDFYDISITENTRAAFTLQDRPEWKGRGGQPKNIIFLTADATGVLPPVARLDIDQAKKYFKLGYTSKVAGTEIGITEPQPTFSPCFAGPFLPLHPTEYANLLADKIKDLQQTEDGVNIWMVNTGWTGEAYDNEGNFDPKKRMKLPLTRTLVNAILNGDLNDVMTETSVFGLEIPTECPDIDSSALNPQTYWRGKEDLFHKQVKDLDVKFKENFKKYEDDSTDSHAQAAPATF